MITIDQIRAIAVDARNASPLPDPRWPPSVYYRFLGLLAKRMNARVFVELGTCGGGASYNVAKMNPATKVISIDLDMLQTVPEIQKQCSNFTFIKDHSIRVAQDIGVKYSKQIDILFIDTIHTYCHSWMELLAWLPYLSPGAVVCFDDLNRKGMDRLWDELDFVKTGFSDLAELHISGGVEDGGFGAIIV